MQRMTAMVVLTIGLSAGPLGAQEVAAPEHRLGSHEPSARVSGEMLTDTNGDGTYELLVLLRSGEVQRFALRSGGSLLLTGVLQLRDPSHTLLACGDLLPPSGVELIATEPTGTFVLAWPAADGVAPAPRAIARRARCALQLFAPQWSPFVQDLDGDGLLDLLVPSLQGCQPWLQSRPDGEEPLFSAMSPLLLPVRIDADCGGDSTTDDHQGALVVPRVETLDLNGDGKPDLVTRQGQRHAFQLQGGVGHFLPAIEVDLEQFEDSTEKAAVAPGSTIVLGDKQMLERGDVDGDGIPDFVIAHRRKIWTFVSSRKGPQFDKARTQAVADDVSAMLVVDLDEDARSDLLTFQVQLPSIGSLLLGLVQSIDIDVRAIGYRSEKDGFAALPVWRRTVTLRIPSLLSLLSRQEELVQRFLDILDKARPLVRGAFTGAGQDDLAMVAANGASIELFAMASAPRELASASGRRMMRTLLFEDPDPVFDLDRIFGVLSGILDQRRSRLRGDAAVVGTAALRDPIAWRVQRLLAANLDGQDGDEVLVIYEGALDPLRVAYDVLTLR